MSSSPTPDSEKDPRQEDSPQRGDGESPPTPSAGNMVRAAVLFEGAILLCAWAVGEIVERPPLAFASWNWADFGWGLAATAPLLAAVIVVMRLPYGPIQELRQFCDEFLVSMFRGSRWSDLLIVSVLAGVGEEMLFRGLVQQGLASAIGGPIGVYFGLAVGAVTFALAHYISRTYAIVAGLVGLYLGLLHIWTGNLLTPMVAHAAYDFGAFVFLFAGQGAKAAEKPPTAG